MGLSKEPPTEMVGGFSVPNFHNTNIINKLTLNKPKIISFWVC